MVWPIGGRRFGPLETLARRISGMRLQLKHKGNLLGPSDCVELSAQVGGLQGGTWRSKHVAVLRGFFAWSASLLHQADVRCSRRTTRAALVSRGRVPLSPPKDIFPPSSLDQCCGQFPPANPNQRVQSEVPTGTFTQPLWHPPPPPAEALCQAPPPPPPQASPRALVGLPPAPPPKKNLITANNIGLEHPPPSHAVTLIVSAEPIVPRPCLCRIQPRGVLGDRQLFDRRVFENRHRLRGVAVQCTEQTRSARVCFCWWCRWCGPCSCSCPKGAGKELHGGQVVAGVWGAKSVSRNTCRAP